MRYFIIFKPFGYLSQFTKEAPHHQTLADLYNFPKGVYPVGRLDKDSEGLLILSDDKRLNNSLLNPKFKHSRTYLAQVDGAITPKAIQNLAKGVDIKVNKKVHATLPAKAKIIEPAPTLPERNPPIRFRKNVPTSWVELTLIEGKNRQVRKMCASVGFPVLRLVRSKIENLHIDGMLIGDVVEMNEQEIFSLLKLKY